MSKEIYISSTPHETRLAIVENDELTEIYYERENEYTLAGSIYNGKVTRVLPGMQSSFVDIGLERDAFLYITDFMEEAGDSADFDTSSANRGSRGDNRRNDRGRDASRDDASLSAGAPEPSAVEGTETAPAGDARPGDGRTGEFRSGDRGRRRRGGNRDQRSSTGEAQPREASASAPAGDIFPTDDSDSMPEISGEFISESSASAPTAAGDLGEGAPGADGSRRWRGRRGRRRGRTGNRSLTDEGTPELTAAEPLELTPDPSAGYDLDDDAGQAGEAFELDAAAEPSPVAKSALQDPTASITAPAAEGSGRGSRDRGRRSRGGRNRDDRDTRSGQDDRTPRALRGFTPSLSLYGVDDAAEQRPYGADPVVPSAAPAEPIILPGEVLSKYRQGGEAVTAGSTFEPRPPAPAPDFALPGAWDGGSVLPGETLRPRPASSESPRQEGRRDDSRRGGRDDRQGGRRDGRSSQRPARSDRDRPSPPQFTSNLTGTTQLAAEPQPNQVPAAEPHAALAPDSSVSFRNPVAPVEHDADGPAVTTPPEVEQRLAEVSAALPSLPHQSQSVLAANQTPEAEYEPTEGSASHRFDPVPPREFRQPAPEAEAPVSLAIEATAAHSITPPAGSPLAPLHDGADHFTEAPAAAHDLTSLTAEGEMLSQAPASPPASEIHEPTSPLQHEAAILDADAEAPGSMESATPVPQAQADDADLAPPAPVAGEPVEDEDLPATLHASSFEEMDYDDDESETLEGAADLGSMIRDMSIDELTQPVDAHDPMEDTDEEDDFSFEEEDSIEELSFNGSFNEAGIADHDDAPAGHDDEDAAEDSAEQFEEHGGSFVAEGIPSSAAPAADEGRNDHRRTGRRDGRRGGRDRGRSIGDRAASDRSSGDRTGTSSDRARGTSSGDRDRQSGSRPGRRDGRHSAQTTNLPAISDLLKPGQEVLVQIAKEPIAKKGARITSHIALPGRFLVFMPTVHHTGVSRKIESDSERRRLKEILLSEKGEASGGFIVRTAAAGATEEELRSDLRFLLNLWADIKQRSESSKSPALIYHDLNLVERILRDQVTDNFSAIWVDTESEYERVLRFLQRFQPSLIRRVKLYTKDTPLFEQFGVTEEINKALRSKVWLKSGGSIVINQTEALVAIDINTGKFVGKTARLEDTIVKTNLDAIPEIVRQIRLRDLGGIIIIDFIDMDERKNRHKVMAVLEEELKKDRAPSKVLQFNDFGLVAITRKRVKQSLERTLSSTCNICQGTGMTKSPVTVCNDIYVEMRKMQKHLDRGDIMLRVNPEVVKQLKSPTAKWLQEMEEMVGKTILVKSDPTLHPEQFDIH